jgi:glycosyltransferase involved in cell wall biosynthesis
VTPRYAVVDVRPADGIRPLRVTHVINSLGLGGAERLLCDLIPRLEGDQVHAEVVCLYDKGPLAAPLESEGVPVRVLGIDREVRAWNWPRTWRRLGDLDVHVVHTHLPESAWYGLPAAYFRRVPVRIGHLQNANRHWATRVRRLDRAASAFGSATVACSTAVADFAREDLGYPANRLEVIPNAIDVTRFDSLPDPRTARRSIGASEDGLLVLCAASLTPQKGHRYLLEAMTAVRSELPGVRLLLAGTGAAERELRRAVTEKRLGDVVSVLGRRDDVPLLMAASDLVVLPSLWEGLPMVLIEAGAAGLPAVASAVGGVAEIVEDGATGLLVPPGDTGRLAETLLALLRDPGRRRMMGEAGRERVRKNFDVRVVIERLESLYHRLLKS